MLNIDPISIKSDGFGNSGLSVAQINKLIENQISDFYKNTILEAAIFRINKLEERIEQLESLLTDQKTKSASDLVLNETRSKLEIRANIVFEELKQAHKLNSATIIYICSLSDKDYKSASAIMDKVIELFPECAYIDLHKKPGQSKGKKWLNLKKGV